MTEPQSSAGGVQAKLFAAGVVAAVATGEATALASVLLLQLLGHTEHLELALYLLAFPVAVPLASLCTRLLLRSPDTPTPELRAFAAVGVVSFGVAIVAARLIDVTGSTAGWLSPRGAMLITVGAASILQVSVLRSGARWAEWRERASHALPTACVAGVLLVFAAFLPGRLAGVGPLVLAAIVGGLLAMGCALRTRSRLSGWRVPAFDAAVVLLIFLLVTDVGFVPIPSNNDDLYVGPINDILHGRAMLVGAYSQYGVANMYFLALVFRLVPLGYYTFEFVNAGLWVVLLWGIYAILRVARVSRRLGVLAVALTILSSVFAELANFGTFGGYPSVGPLRFGLPFIVVLAMVAGSRRDHRVIAHSVAIGVVAISAIWSFETFVYAGATFLAACGAEAVSRDNGRGRFVRLVVAAAGACVLSHVVFAIATRIFAGAWPDWPGYLEFIRVYGSQGFGQLPVDAWSIGLPMAFFYFCSALAVVSIALWRRDAVKQNREGFMAVVALTALSIVAFTYFLGRSHPNNLHNVAPPAIALAATWVGFASAAPVPFGHQARSLVLALALAASSLLIVETAPDFLTTWHRTFLYRAIPIVGHGSLRDAVRERWKNPPIDPRAPLADRLLASELPGERQTVVLVDPNLTVEVLLRAGRINALPMSAPLDDNLVPGAPARMLTAIERFRTGTGLLLQVDATGRADTTVLNALQRTSLQAIQARFTLKRVKAAAPFVVMRLVRKAAPAG